MMHTKNQSGYILMLTLALISLAMFMSVYIFTKGFTFSRFGKTMVDREKARQLAYGGIELAKSLLATVEKQPANQEQQKKEAAAKTTAASSDGAQLLKAVLPNLNKLQKFTLKQQIEGINGTLSLAIGSEEGKININRLYDFEKHEFVGQGQPNGDMRALFKELFALINEKVKVDLFPAFEKFLKERKYPLNDVTQLLTIPGFENFKYNLFYDPAGKQDTIYLTDIFTLASSKKEIEPWLFSSSIKTLLQIKNQKEKISIDEVLKTFKEQNDWKNDWNKVMQPLYGIDYNSLPKGIAGLLNPAFGPKVFSVLSQATVSSVTVTVWAILEREKGSGKDAVPIVHVRKVYLL